MSVTVTNRGERAGREVAQLYLSKPRGRLEQPARVLIEFEKTRLLSPSECETLTMSVPLQHMANFDEEAAAWVAVKGNYRVFLGGSAGETKEIGRFALEEDRVLRYVKHRMRPNLPFTRLTQRDPTGSYPEGELSGVQKDAHSLPPGRENPESFSHTELPRTGRQPEYFSEDHYLAGTIAGYYCKGLESTEVGGCCKHLIANNAESARKRNQSAISERAIRELYFRAFQIALEVQEPLSVMTAYNAVNGLFTSCDAELCGVIRNGDWRRMLRGLRDGRGNMKLRFLPPKEGEYKVRFIGLVD